MARKEKPLFPIIDRPTPIIDRLRKTIEPAEESLLKDYSWLATWGSLALALGAMAVARSS